MQRDLYTGMFFFSPVMRHFLTYVTRSPKNTVFFKSEWFKRCRITWIKALFAPRSDPSSSWISSSRLRRSSPASWWLKEKAAFAPVSPSHLLFSLIQSLHFWSNQTDRKYFRVALDMWLSGLTQFGGNATDRPLSNHFSFLLPFYRSGCVMYWIFPCLPSQPTISREDTHGGCLPEKRNFSLQLQGGAQQN